MDTLNVLNKSLPVYRCGALVIGTGCAGYNAADWLYDMGYEDYFYGRGLCFIEWPERVEELLPEETVKVTIEELSDGSRVVAF